jgi:hypothetical protein
MGLGTAVAWLLALWACAQSDVASLRSATMPDPGGCYVVVYEQAGFTGAREYINGPRRYATPDDLPFAQTGGVGFVAST